MPKNGYRTCTARNLLYNDFIHFYEAQIRQNFTEDKHSFK